MEFSKEVFARWAAIILGIWGALLGAGILVRVVGAAMDWRGAVFGIAIFFGPWIALMALAYRFALRPMLRFEYSQAKLAFLVIYVGVLLALTYLSISAAILPMNPAPLLAAQRSVGAAGAMVP